VPKSEALHPPTAPEILKRNLQTIQARIQISSPPMHHATLVAVTKTRSLEDIQTLYQLGVRDFGENRVSELSQKAQALKDYLDIRWHFIGNLQTNKLNKLKDIPQLWAIHSVDRVDLLEALMEKLHLSQGPLRLFFQVNTSGEEEKSGFNTQAELDSALRYFFQNNTIGTQGHKRFYFQGLMTMATIRTTDLVAEAHRCFQLCQQYAKRVETEFRAERSHFGCELSMGMSQDFEIALKYQSRWLRIGSVLFEKQKD
jgi:pyridoxal phosphate enzyme (YggS family)